MATKRKVLVKKSDINIEDVKIISEELEHLEFIQESNKFFTVVYDLNWKKFQKKYTRLIQNINDKDKNFREYIKKHTKTNTEIFNNFKKNILFIWASYCKIWNKVVNKNE
jgi:hypothetical protein